MALVSRAGAFAGLFVVYVVFMGPAALAGPDSPSAVVARFQTGLLETMRQARVLGLKGRYEKLTPLIGDAFHLPLMIATASAPYWRKGGPGERKALLAAFARMSAGTVATLFDDYGRERFEIVGERATGGPTTLVDTRILRPEKDAIRITYVTAPLGGRWWIIDIIVDGGISELKIRRGEYLSLLRDGGLPGLAAALNATADRLLSGKKAAAVTGPDN